MRIAITQTASDKIQEAIVTNQSIIFSRVQLSGTTTYSTRNVHGPSDGIGVGVSALIDKNDVSGNPVFNTLNLYAKLGESGSEFLFATTGVDIDFGGSEDRKVIVTVRLEVSESDQAIFEYSGGDDAYQVAVRQGFEGTPQDWLQSLIGPQGPEGPEGPEGPRGLPGEIEGLLSTHVVDALGYLPVNPTDLTWGNLLNKPTTFTPSAHTHTIANVTGLQSAIDSKAGTAVATTQASGLMSSSDKTKLNGLSSNAATLQGRNASAFMQVVNHGTQTNTARPIGALAVYWLGSVEPNNAQNGDIWVGGD